MTASTPTLLGKKSQEAVVQFYRQCFSMVNQQWNIREQLRQVDLTYIREKDFTKEHQRAKLANRLNDADRLQNLTIPVVLPVVEAAVTYQASVFLTGNPIFGVVADPINMDAAMQMETVIDNQSVRGGWSREFIMFFRDNFKYNLAAIEVAWDREVTAALETDLTFAGGRQAKPKEVIWEGNCIKRLDMYNTFFDSRVAPALVYRDGEFAGYTELVSRIKLKQFIKNLPDAMIDNVKEAFESGIGTINGAGGTSFGGIETFYIPPINNDALINKNTFASTDWMAWAGVSTQRNPSDIQYKNLYQLTTLYGRILPSDFGIRTPGANTPQIWKFIIVNHSVLIYAERQTNAHGYIPILFSQALEDGLNYQTKSLAMNVAPIQDISSALMNSVIAARRRSISDRGLYDPSRVSEAHINSANPSAKIPVRPSAYGKPLSEAYFPIPFRDDASPQALQQIGILQQFANTISGQNQARQGQFVKGNKTLHEYESVMANANGRDQLTSMLLEAQVFTPLKYILKQNILQYQGGISLLNRNTQQQVKIDPVALRTAALQFKVSDGLIPADKLIGAEVLGMAMQAMGSNPAIGAEYNMNQLFSYLMKTQGAELAPFEKPAEQVAYEQAVSAWSSTVQQLAKQMGDAIDPAKFPPQPVPQQFGWNPQQARTPQSSSTRQLSATGVSSTPIAASAPNTSTAPSQQ